MLKFTQHTRQNFCFPLRRLFRWEASWHFPSAANKQHSYFRLCRCESVLFWALSVEQDTCKMLLVRRFVLFHSLSTNFIKIASFKQKLTFSFWHVTSERKTQSSTTKKCQEIPAAHTKQQAYFLSVCVYALACGVFEWAGMCTQKVEPLRFTWEHYMMFLYRWFL